MSRLFAHRPITRFNIRRPELRNRVNQIKSCDRVAETFGIDVFFNDTLCGRFIYTKLTFNLLYKQATHDRIPSE